MMFRRFVCFVVFGRLRQIGDTFFVLREGTAMVTQTTKDGENHIRRLEEYACFGERALLKAEPRHASVIAETKVTLAGEP